jgi:hypothetical protein
VLVCAWPALLLATVCLLPFLSKAFTNDDPEYLGIARQVLKSPLHPMDFDVCWISPPLCAKLYELTPGNTMMGYALVPAVLGGGAEWMAHITQLVLVWVAILAMSAFMPRLGWSKRDTIIGSLLLVAIPPLLPMASTARPDVLALAVGLVGIERLAAWKDERKLGQGAVAALALGLAGVARPHLALLLPLGAFFLLESLNPWEILLQVRKSLWLWFPVAAGGLLLAAVILATRERGLALTPPATFSGLEHIRANLRSYLLFFCFPLPLGICWVLARWTISPRQVVSAILSAIAVTLLVGGKQLVLVLTGGYALTGLLWDAWKNRDRESLFLGLWLLVPLPVAYYGHFPIKYLLPCMPALILICLRLGSMLPVRIARIGSILLIAGGMSYSLLILRPDAKFADFGRDALSALIRPHVLTGEKIWFLNQFSANWYAPQAGAELMIPGVREPERGDLIVVGAKETSRPCWRDFRAGPWCRYSSMTMPSEGLWVRAQASIRTRAAAIGSGQFAPASPPDMNSGGWIENPGRGRQRPAFVWRVPVI